MTRSNLFVCQALLGLIALFAAIPADANSRIVLRDGGKTDDVVVIDETSIPPMVTVTEGVSVKGGPGAMLDLGGGQYEILDPGNTEYHMKTRGGVDDVTVIDGPGESTYWLGVGAEGDTLVIHDGPGDDRYKVEGKSGDDVFEIHDDSGDGDDYYYIKTAKGADLLTVNDGPGDDFYKVKARPEATAVFNDNVVGDVDTFKTKGIEFP